GKGGGHRRKFGRGQRGGGGGRCPEGQVGAVTPFIRERPPGSRPAAVISARSRRARRPRSTSAPCSISSVIEAANPPPHPALRAWSSAPRAAHARELMAGPNVEGKAQQTRVVAMRGVAMTYPIGAELAVSSAALAPNNADEPTGPGAQATGRAGSDSGQPTNVREAPIGHRQPKAKDVPRGIEENLGARSPEDAAVDRKLRICRDC